MCPTEDLYTSEHLIWVQAGWTLCRIGVGGVQSGVDQVDLGGRFAVVFGVDLGERVAVDPGSFWSRFGVDAGADSGSVDRPLVDVAHRSPPPHTHLTKILSLPRSSVRGDS